MQDAHGDRLLILGRRESLPGRERFRGARRRLRSLLDFLTRGDDWLFDLAFAQTKEFAQLRTNHEQRARQHRTRYLDKEESGAWIGVGIGRLLKRDSQRGYLGDGKQRENNTGEVTQSMPPLDFIQSKVRGKVLQIP
jgi:hypothetical protein